MSPWILSRKFIISLVTLTGDGLEMSFPWEQATHDRCLGKKNFLFKGMFVSAQDQFTHHGRTEMAKPIVP